MIERDPIGRRNLFTAENFRSVLGTTAMLTAAAAAAIGVRGAIERNDGEVLPRAEAIAKALASERNTCVISEADIKPDKLGGPVLAITIALEEKARPSSRNGVLDRRGVKVGFRDDPDANLLDGVLVVRRSTYVGVDSLQFTYTPGEGPLGPTNTTVVKEPMWRTSTSEVYDVYRVNATQAVIRGPLVSDREPTQAGRVNCGAVSYNPKSGLEIIPPEVE